MVNSQWSPKTTRSPFLPPFQHFRSVRRQIATVHAVQQVLQRAMALIASRQDRHGHRPWNCEFRIVVGDTSFTGRIVERRALVFDVRDVAEDAETMGTAWRHV